MPLEIREAAGAEVEAVRVLSLQSVVEGVAGQVPAQDVESSRMLEAFDGVLARGGSLLVAAEGDRIIGYALFGSGGPDFFTGRRVGFIYDVFVRPSGRRRGVGRRLLEACLDRLRQAGFDEVRLNVFAENRARQLYRDIGFRDYTVVMQKPLSSDG